MNQTVHVAELSYCDRLTDPSAEPSKAALLAAIDQPDGSIRLLLSTLRESTVYDPVIREFLEGEPPGLTAVIDDLFHRSARTTSDKVVQRLSEALKSSLFVSSVTSHHVSSVDLDDPADLFGTQMDVRKPAVLPVNLAAA